MKATIFLSTRNRTSLLRKCLQNITEQTSHCQVLIGNASSSTHFPETSEIINSFPNCKEVSYKPDPGLSIVYSELYKLIQTPLGIVWADDMTFLKDPYPLFRHFNSTNTHLIALPMIDDISRAPATTGSGWKKDNNGCALWETNTGRCAHHAITRVDFFKKFGDVCGKGDPNDVIDNFCHRHTDASQRVWPNIPYVLHERVDDDTRFNTLLSKDNFRFPKFATSKSSKQRD